MYQIKLNNMKFKAHIGVLKEEKIIGQMLEIDLLVETNFDFSGKDALDETLSYVSFYELTQKIVQCSRVDLIEKLAFDIITAIKSSHSEIQTVEIHLRKLAVPIDGIFDSAEVIMKR
ncbi:dihydroneopterin aldolase [Lactococcus hircilactis]|uniref:7,8-dihydroneopterin aldolase n=1 Tax=Lactococcus hircilactis TaxID=1494462 RepID=A0A7X2CZS9_9LACT|nr:dihydroneopterin aldolase [Lactococcus hircilactis]MQW38468.1 dihydroneopterin aldolase [Lactococcus hircilactis]